MKKLSIFAKSYINGVAYKQASNPYNDVCFIF